MNAKPMGGKKIKKKKSGLGLLGLVKPYGWFVAGIIALTVASNGLNLVVPKLIARAIDAYGSGGFNIQTLAIEFLPVTVFIFIFTYLQGVVQTYASEMVARDLRTGLVAKLAGQNYSFIESVTPARILTNLTSDADAVKSFVSLVIPSMVSSVFLILGASALMFVIDWKLTLAILAVMPFIGLAFFLVLGRVHKLFTKSQETIDWLNRVINESILGSAIVRILNSQGYEYEKFSAANIESKNIGLTILKYFAGLIPAVTFIANLATLIIVGLGGYFVIGGTMSLGSFAAFNSYLAMLIFPIIIISFMSTVIAQADASYGRINEVLDAPEPKETGMFAATLRGDILVENAGLVYGQKTALKSVSIKINAGTRTAIIGPTAAGKTQLMYIIAGLLEPASGAVYYDGRNINEYDKASLHRQVGLVFQDSIIFNISLRENIAFSSAAAGEDVDKAIGAAELRGFVDSFPDKLDTIVSERGTSLSGGQKQRIMLARALALNPKVLLLDDFTARVDNQTERKILANIGRQYPGITLVSVTQKINPVKDYDQIILLMEGEVLASGTHKQLMKTSPEYMQIYNSQKSTNEYELRA
ncbi:MAG: ABC transporter ATP-binding protein [Minisyncoccales bacterium]